MSKNVASNLSRDDADVSLEQSAGKPQPQRSDEVIKWIPIVLPLLAVLIVLVVYFIDWAVLSYST